MRGSRGEDREKARREREVRRKGGRDTEEERGKEREKALQSLNERVANDICTYQFRFGHIL